MEVHSVVDALHHTSEGSERQRLLWVVSTDHKALLAHGQEVGKQVWDDGNVTITTSGLGRAQEGLVVGVGCVSLDMDDILHQIEVFPAQAQDFALPHASEDDNGEVEPVCSIQLAEGRDTDKRGLRWNTLFIAMNHHRMEIDTQTFLEAALFEQIDFIR